MDRTTEWFIISGLNPQCANATGMPAEVCRVQGNVVRVILNLVLSDLAGGSVPVAYITRGGVNYYVAGTDMVTGSIFTAPGSITMIAGDTLNVTDLSGFNAIRCDIQFVDYPQDQPIFKKGRRG